MSNIEIWFRELPLFFKCLLALLGSPLFFLIVGTIAFMGMGFGTAGESFGKNPKIRKVLVETIILGLVVTIGVGLIWGLIALVFFVFSLLRYWLVG